MSKEKTFETNHQKDREINKISDQVREVYKSDAKDYTFLNKYEEFLCANATDRQDTEK
jgi:hypothetical protein